MKSLLLGLSLEGVLLGLNLETRTTLHEFVLERVTYKTYAFQSWDGWAHPARSYSEQNVSRYSLSWRFYAREDFRFMSAQWRYGVGFGLGTALKNKQLRLVDSSVTNVIHTFEVFPTTALFLQINMDEKNSLKLVGSLDASSDYPFSGNVLFLFSIGL